MDIQRRLNLPTLLEKKSHFLLGPRGTGKSFLVRQQLIDQAFIIDLLRSDNFLRLSSEPAALEKVIVPQISKTRPYVVIDEIQKLPALLNEVHRLIEEKKYKFLLTGSSSRKLKSQGSNLLAGRAWPSALFPLSWAEIPNFNLDRYLRYGGLPSVYLSKYPEDELNAYVQTYLKEEVMAEGLIRNLPPFSRFLISASLSNGQLLNFNQIGSDAEVAPSTVREYYSILEDTLLGFMLEPWSKSKKRKAVSTAKFYFFDPGVVNAIAGIRGLERHSDLYGRSLEHFVGMELRAYLSYQNLKLPLRFWRSKHNHEVDYIVDDTTAIEVKATRKVTGKDLRGLSALAEEKVMKKLFLVSHDPLETREGNLHCLPWDVFLKKLWSGSIDF